jgi:uncharacterized membrane protein (UPF0127 family)
VKQQVIIQNRSRPLASPIIAYNCASFWCRLRGLTFRRDLPPGDGLLLVQSRENKLDASIHMLFVWFDLAVVWINSAGKVVDVRLAKSWHPIYFPSQPAQYVLELAVARRDDFAIGDHVVFEFVRDEGINT